MATIVADFEKVSASDLDTMSPATCDDLPFGVIGLDRQGVARLYNATEAHLAGLDPASVIGVPFFDAIAQCMNNYLVAQRFEDECELDEIIPFVLTLRMRPTKVRLRLLATDASPHRYVLIER